MEDVEVLVAIADPVVDVEAEVDSVTVEAAEDSVEIAEDEVVLVAIEEVFRLSVISIFCLGFRGGRGGDRGGRGGFDRGGRGGFRGSDRGWNFLESLFMNVSGNSYKRPYEGGNSYGQNKKTKFDD